MNQKERESRVKDIRNFIAVIASAVLGALLIAGILVYYYSPSGRYNVDQVVLSPEIAGKLENSGNQSGLVFDGVEFVYYLGSKKGWARIQASNEVYENFFNLISGNKSLWDVPEEIVRDFDLQKPASILIRVKGGPVLASRVFQEIQILPDGHFRVELRQIDDRNRWAYFHQDDVYSQTEKVFLPQ